MNFRALLRILRDEGFTQVRQTGSHRTYEGFVAGRRQIVQVAYHLESDEVAPGTLGSIVRQSGLPKRRFR